MKGVEVKRSHYRLLSKFYKEYISLADLFEDLSVRLRSDEELKREYCQAVKKSCSVVSLWWEPIKLLKELGLCC